MQLAKMILFFAQLASTPVLAQNIALMHNLDSDTVITSQEEDISIRLHSLEATVDNVNSLEQSAPDDSNFELAIHKLTED